jgi:hypothetical protein
MKYFHNGFHKFIFGYGSIIQFDPNTNVHHFADVVLLVAYEWYSNQWHCMVRGFMKTLQATLRYEQLDIRMS